MANGIIREQKLGKQNRQKTGIANNPLNKNSSTSNSHNNFNEKLM